MAGAAEHESEHNESIAAVGATIRSLRLRHGLSLRDLSRLTARAPDRVLEPILVTVQPTETIEEPYSHEGEEFADVLTGDSIHFRSTVPHSVHNDTGEPVQALWVLTPRLL